MAQMQVFLSHSSKDKAFADQLVAALRRAGTDVWYDEHNLGAGVLRREINDQLARRSVVIVLLSKAALISKWVQDECEWAYNLYRRKPDRLMLPVVAASYDPDDFDQMLFLESFKRVEAPGHQPYPPVEAIARTLRLLELTPTGEHPTIVLPPHPAATLEDLLTTGRALAAQGKYSEALACFERGAQMDPRSYDAWANLGYLYSKAKRYQDALTACDRALALDDNQAWVWANKGYAHNNLRDVSVRHLDEALAAYNRALALEPDVALTWNNKSRVLMHLMRFDEALAACQRALALDPTMAMAWGNLAASLRALGRTSEAEEAERRAKALDG